VSKVNVIPVRRVGLGYTGANTINGGVSAAYISTVYVALRLTSFLQDELFSTSQRSVQGC